MSQSAPEDAKVKESNAAWWQGIAVNGFVSLSYSHNANAPATGLNQFRVFDFANDEPKLDVAELVVQHAADNPNEFGFRTDLELGSSVPEVEASYGLFRDKRTNVAHHYDVQQAFVRYVVPLGKGLHVDAGKFVTHLGYEVIDGYDGYNDNYSRGWLFGYGIPFTHTGVKATYALTSRLSGMLMVANGWDNVHDNNQAKSLGAQLAFAASKQSSIYVNWMGGAERTGDNHDRRNVGEVIATWSPGPSMSFAADALYGQEQNAVAPGRNAEWKALAVYARVNPTTHWSFAIRGEVFADAGGSRTGTAQTLRGVTFTPEFHAKAAPSQWSHALRRLDGNFVVRGELRLDGSDHHTFEKAGGFSNRQFTSAVNLIYTF